MIRVTNSIFICSSEELVYILESILKAELFPDPAANPFLSDPAGTLSSPIHSFRCLTPETAHQLVRAAVQVHTKLGTMFLATPDRLHYRFTLKDLTAVFRYVCMTGGDNVRGGWW